MAHLPIIDFAWKRDPKGYRMSDSEPLRRIVRNGPNGSETACRPLMGDEFRIFASYATSDAGLLDFVHRFGPLTWDGWASAKGDLVALVTFHARSMRELLTASAEGRAPVPDGGPVYLANSSVRAGVVWDPATKGPRWHFRPNTLLDALWLQFGQAVTRGAQIRACQHCGVWFE